MRFCITGLPRSRTAWFAAYFTATGHKCAHEPFSKCRTEDELENAVNGYEGIADSFMVFLPFRGKRVIIERNPDKVKKSLFNKFGLDIDDSDYMIDCALENMRVSDGLRVKFEEIDSRLQEIHEYCVDTPYDKEIGDLFKNMNIQVNKVEITPEFKELVGGMLCQHGL